MGKFKYIAIAIGLIAIFLASPAMFFSWWPSSAFLFIGLLFVVVSIFSLLIDIIRG